VHVVRLVLLVGVPLLVAGFAVACWFLVGAALQPVAALRRGVGDITEAGTGARLPVPPTRDEVARLAETLNDMLDRLAAGGARQRAFVADAAHELRSPLASIRTQLEVAAGAPRGRVLVGDGRRRARRRGPGSAAWSTTCCCWPGWTTTGRRCAAPGRSTWVRSPPRQSRAPVDGCR
jgi:signal transduction histidine kinase